MGYMDSRYLVNHYTIALSQDKSKGRSLASQASNIKQQQNMQGGYIDMNFRSNQSRISNMYSAQRATLQAAIDQETDSTELSKLQQQLADLDAEERNALAGLEQQKKTTMDQMTAYYENIDTRLKMDQASNEFDTMYHTNCLEEARKAVKEALQMLFPKSSNG